MRKNPLFLSLLLAGLTVLPAAVAAGPTPLLAQTADQCLAVLKDPGATRKARMDACRQLGVLGGPDAVPVLAPLLADPELSHMARYALEPNPSPAVDEAFRAALGKLRGRLLVGVIGSVGIRRDAQAVPALAKLLDAGDPEVARAAARALGGIGTTEAADALLAAVESAPPANLLDFCEGLARCAERLLADGHREQALAIYDHYNDESLPCQVRQAALRGAILARGKEGLPLLQQSLTRPEYILFAAAIRAALEIKDPAITQILSATLPKLDADRQIVVAQTLGQRGDPAGAQPLFALAQNGPQPVRLAAVRALGRLRDLAVLPLLEGLLADPDPEISHAAREGYASLPGAKVDRAITDLLGDLDPGTRKLAIELVQRRRMTRAIPTLLKSAAAPEAEVRLAAIKALGALAARPQLPALLDLLLKTKSQADRDALQAAVAQVCARTGAPQSCAGAIIDRLGRGGPASRRALLHLLGGVGGAQALAAVQASLKDSDAGVRATALRVLANWHTADAGPELLAQAQQAADPADKMVALRGYLRLATQAELPTEKRLAWCRAAEKLTRRPEEKRLLLGALGAIPAPDTVTLIAPHLKDAAVRNEAGAALLNVAERLLKGKNAARVAPALAPLLQQLAAGDNAALAQRARKALAAVRAAGK